MKISVVIVCYNEKKNIVVCLNSLLEQTYPSDKYEILVVDNNSTDGTRAIVQKYIQRNPSYSLRLIINPIKGISISRNIGWKEAQYDFVAYTDADCRAPRQWLEVMADGFKRYAPIDDHLAGVGGANIPSEKQGNFMEGLGILLDTFWGNHGSTQGKRFSEDTVMQHIPTLNILYEKKVLEKLQGFDETYHNICEDTEFNHRLKLAGYHLMFLKNSFVFHKMRTNFYKWFLNMITYGKGRIWVIQKHPSHFHVLFLIPPLFILAMVLPFFAWLTPLCLLPLFYFPILGVITGYELCRRKKGWRLFPSLFFSYLVTHIGYGLGEWYGLLRGRKKE